MKDKKTLYFERKKNLISVIIPFHNNEGTIEKCVKSILNQSYKNFDYFTLDGLSNKDAHTELYKKFKKSQNFFQICIKLDADMVFSSRNSIQNIVKFYNSNYDTEDLEIGVFDCMTERVVYGLHAYSSNVDWQIPQNDLFVDFNSYIKNRVHDKSLLSPIAYHCPNPSFYQCYHFGIHKSLKVSQRNIKNIDYQSRKYHSENILILIRIFNTTQNINTAYSLLGVYISFYFKFNYDNSNIQNKINKDHFSNFDSSRLIPFLKTEGINFIISELNSFEI